MFGRKVRCMKTFFTLMVVAALATTCVFCPWAAALAKDKSVNLTRLETELVMACKMQEYLEAMAVAEKTLSAALRELGKNHIDVAVVSGILGELYFYLGIKVKTANKLSNASLHLFDKIAGDAVEENMKEFNGVISSYMSRGRSMHAIPYAKWQLYRLEQDLGSNSPALCMPMAVLAQLYKQQGMYAKAEFLFKQSIQILISAKGKDCPEVAYVYSILGDLYFSQMDFSRALPLYKRAQKILEKNFGKDHKDALIMIENQIRTYQAMGQEDKVKECEEQLAEIRGFYVGDQAKDHMYECVDNMRYLQDTIEMHEMNADEPLAAGQEGIISLEPLVASGFISDLPLCRDSGEYRFNGAARVVMCSVHNTVADSTPTSEEEATSPAMLRTYRFKRAEKDLRAIKRAVDRANSMEPYRVNVLSSLEGKYMTRVPSDPWSGAYKYLPESGIIRCNGPDQIPGTDDDLTITCESGTSTARGTASAAGTAHPDLENIARISSPEERSKRLTRIVESSPSAEAYYLLAIAYDDQGNERKYIESLKQALAQDPWYAKALNDYGLLLQDKGRIDDAIEQFERAVESDPNCSPAFHSLGWLYWKQKKDLERAIECFQCYLLLNSNSSYSRKIEEYIEQLEREQEERGY